MNALEDFLTDLETKGFKFNDEAIGFIYFGRKFTNASDINVKTAIELTLKVQQRFDSGFYMSVLEEIVQSELKTRQKTIDHFRKKGITI